MARLCQGSVYADCCSNGKCWAKLGPLPLQPCGSMRLDLFEGATHLDYPLCSEVDLACQTHACLLACGLLKP